MGAAKLGIVLIGVGFPLYLLYTGRLAAYLAMVKGSPVPQQALASPSAIGQGFGVPVIPPGVSPQVPQGGTIGVMPGSELGLF